MVKGKGERGKSGETILESIFALVVEDEKEFTAASIGKRVEKAVNKDRDGVRREFQRLFTQKKQYVNIRENLIPEFVRRRKESGTTYYSLDVSNLRKLSYFSAYIGDKTYLDSRMLEGFETYIHLKLKLHMHYVVDYLHLWDPFIDKKYRIPKRVLYELIKDGITHYRPSDYPVEGINKLKTVSQPVFNYLYTKISEEKSITKFLDFIRNMAQSYCDNCGDVIVTDLNSLLSIYSMTRTISRKTGKKANYRNMIPALVRPTPVQHTQICTEFCLGIPGNNNIGYLDTIATKAGRSPEYHWIKGLWEEGCNQLFDSDLRPKITDIMYPSIRYDDIMDSYTISLWPGSSRYNSLNNSFADDGLQTYKQSIEKFYKNWGVERKMHNLSDLGS